MANVFRSMGRLVCFALVLAAPLAARAAEPPPLEAYGQLPAVEDAAISPSGLQIAVVGLIKGQRQLRRGVTYAELVGNGGSG
ncbi:MAG: hypothetical protein ABIP41_02885 [Croceibacterium sp.]